MLFHIYGETSLWQLLGWCLVFCGLIIANEFARRTKVGGILAFFVLPIALTIYFIAINIGAKTWAVNNDTIVQMNGWFHYAKLYAATIGCVGFMVIKYHWGKLGKVNWFKCWPFVIVGINILIAVASDFESAAKGFAAGGAAGGWWYSSEGVWLFGGWWNVLNGIAGLINIMCMTGWFGVYSSADKHTQDMLWPDMTWQFILAYDVWNFEYTYCNLPLHTWYCGVALLLAPTFANKFWNKGGWIQNRANTLALWCMFAQVFPSFQNESKFTVLPVLYRNVDKFLPHDGIGRMAADIAPTAADANPIAQGVVAILALAVNVLVLTSIIKRAKAQHINPYTKEVFKGTADFEEAMARAVKEA